MQEVLTVSHEPDILERIDGAKRVAGRAHFTADTGIEGTLYGRIVPSTIAHGRVKHIDVSGAARLDGVAAILTSEDTIVRWPSGDRQNERVVFTKTPRFYGDCIGAIAGVSREICERAVSLVSVDYEELPSSFETHFSLTTEAPKIWPAGNIQRQYKHEFGDMGRSFGQSDFFIRNIYKTHRHHCAPLEPAVSLANWYADRLEVHASTQGISRCRRELSMALGMEESKIRVVCKFKGGGFGNKNGAMDYDIIAALLSKKARKPVLLEYTRSEDFTNVHGRWGTNQDVSLGVAKTGKLLAYRVNAICDIGAYGRHPAGKYVDGPENIYSLQGMDVKVTPVYTNTHSTGNMRAPVGVPSTFAIETAVDEAAYLLGLDPLQFRLNNLAKLSEGKLPFSSSGLSECIRRGADLFDWKGSFIPHTKNRREFGRCRGVGIALAAWHSEIETSSARIKLEKDGTVTVSAGIVDIGTGAKTALALTVARELGINRSQINVDWGDTETCPPFVGESGSKTTATIDRVVKQTALKFKDSIMEQAESIMKVRKSLLLWDGGYVKSGEVTERISLKELASLARRMPEAVETVATEIPVSVARSSFAAHFCEVLVDVDLGKISVERYVAVHDSGRIVNKLTAVSQVHGGVVMGIGLALMEELEIDNETGTLLNPSLNSYHIPRNDDIPQIDVDFIETDDPYGPKSLGEVPVMPASPCIGNAVYNATGIRIREMPITPLRFQAAMQGQRY